MENSKRNSGFNHGFLLGIIVGAALVFFLFTKKGRILLNKLSEEGLEGIGGLTDLLEDNEEVVTKVKAVKHSSAVHQASTLYPKKNTSQKVEETMPVRPVVTSHIHADKAPKDEYTPTSPQAVPSKTRQRMFKGIPKRH